MVLTQWLYPLVISFVLCAALGKVILPLLRKLHVGQSIRGCGPQTHKKKSGTPTMGGIMIIIAVVVSTLWCVDKVDKGVLIALWLMVGHGVIGLIDDSLKVVFHRNLGLTSLQKLIMQVAVALFYLVVGTEGQLAFTRVWVPFVNCTIECGPFYYVLALLLLVGTTNAVNLTDGLDGLVSSVSLPVCLAYALIASGAGLANVSIFACTVAGAVAGFWLYNHYPAKVFMGDTGSLSLGGAIAALALLTKTELLLVIVGGVYVVEALSVILQVTYFRFTHGKRLFRMSPIHHHFELGGWSEVEVVRAFTAVSTVLSIVGVLLLGSAPFLK